jgi:hypothetical protein
MMNWGRSTVYCCIISILVCCSTVEAAQGQLGLGYGKELRGNRDLSQLELFYRLPLSWTKKLGEDWRLSTDLEFAGAVIDDNNSDTSSTGRVSLMPQMMLSPNSDSFYLLLGLGAGFMMGETEFEDHNLGGPFFLSSKVGVLFFIGNHFGIEYNFYHQSNAGIYDYNASLNMHHLALSYRF